MISHFGTEKQEVPPQVRVARHDLFFQKMENYYLMKQRNNLWDFKFLFQFKQSARKDNPEMLAFFYPAVGRGMFPCLCHRAELLICLCPVHFPQIMVQFFFFFTKNYLIKKNYCCYKYGYCYYCSPGQVGSSLLVFGALSFGVLLDRGVGDNDESPFLLLVRRGQGVFSL